MDDMSIKQIIDEKFKMNFFIFFIVVPKSSFCIRSVPYKLCCASCKSEDRSFICCYKRVKFVYRSLINSLISHHFITKESATQMPNPRIANINGRKTTFVLIILLPLFSHHVKYIQCQRNESKDAAKEDIKRYLMRDLIDFSKRDFQRNIWYLVGFILIIVIPITAILCISVYCALRGRKQRIIKNEMENGKENLDSTTALVVEADDDDADKESAVDESDLSSNEETNHTNIDNMVSQSEPHTMEATTLDEERFKAETFDSMQKEEAETPERTDVVNLPI